MAKMCPGLYTSGRIFSWYSTVVWLSDYRFHLTYLLQCFQSLTMSQVQVNFKCFFPLQNLHGNLKPPILEKYIRYYWISNFIWINGVKYMCTRNYGKIHIFQVKEMVHDNHELLTWVITNDHVNKQTRTVKNSPNCQKCSCCVQFLRNVFGTGLCEWHVDRAAMIVQSHNCFLFNFH